MFDFGMYHPKIGNNTRNVFGVIYIFQHYEQETLFMFNLLCTEVNYLSCPTEGDTNPSKIVEKAQHRTPLESRGTTEASSAVAALGTADNSAGGDVSAASSVSSPQSLRSLAIGR